MQSELRFRFIFQPHGLIYRSLYRPEVYLRDQQSEMYKVEKENIEKEKLGEKPTASSPLVLWH